MKRTKEAEKKWKKIIVEIDGKVKKYNLNKSEKLSNKFQIKIRKNVTKKYKEYIKSHPNMKVRNMEELSFGYEPKKITNDSPAKKTKYQTRSYKEEAYNPNLDAFEFLFDEKTENSKESDNYWGEEQLFFL